MSLRAVIALAATLALFAFASKQAWTDSWYPPTTEVYYSVDKHVRLTVVPRGISSAFDYFEDQARGRNLPGQVRKDKGKFARALVERQHVDGRWRVVWSWRLVNDVSPVKALVTRAGSHVATFDNWHFVGAGGHVVVIYRQPGELIRSLSLRDFLPDYYIEALPRSVSSVRWGGAHYLSELSGELVLKVRVPSDDDAGERFVNLAVSLSDGQVRPIDQKAWQDALEEALRVAKDKRAGESAEPAAFRAPLLGPTTPDARDWHCYLFEAFHRVDAGWKDGYPTTVFLQAPTAPYYSRVEKRLRDRMLDKHLSGDVVMIASPEASENLLRVLGEIFQRADPSLMKGVKVYVAAPSEFQSRLSAIFKTTPVTFVYLDPKVPIPQRPERLKRRFGPAG